MALSVSTQANPVATSLIVQTDASEESDDDILNASATVYLVDIDNSDNATDPSYVKLYNTASPTVGTTAPDVVLMIPAATRRQCAWPEGLAFDTSLSMCCVTAGGTSGTTGPTSAVTVRILAS